VEWVETTGKTVEEAKELALDQLGVDAKEAEFELVEEPKSGLFGRTRGTARVRARVVPLTPPPKTERRRRGKKTDGSDGPANGGSDRSSSGKAAASAPAASATSDADTAAASPAPPSNGGRRRQGGAGTSRAASDTPREIMDADEQIKVLEDFLTELAASFGLSATASSTLEDNELTVNLSGEQLGLLVGPRLATLDAVQEIARNALQRQAAGREYAKVVVDVEHIRRRRRDSLTTFVNEAGRQVLDEDVEVVFEVMSSVDRKQVHDVAAEIDGVASASEGEDPRRRVVLRKA
jgi:spoIIIJ-associated protein